MVDNLLYYGDNLDYWMACPNRSAITSTPWLARWQWQDHYA